MRSRVVGTLELPSTPTVPVVVIDVLRAFTTAGFVLDGGASQLLLARSDEEALRLKSGLGPQAIAIKDGELAEGFELGNSPGQVRRADLRGRPVVMRTTNGTTAVHRAIEAPMVLCASLVNASATAQAIAASNAQTVIYVITGDGGRAEEDLACAEHIHALVVDAVPPEGTVDQVRNSSAAADLADAVARGYRGVAVDDVGLSSDIDRFGFAMFAHRETGSVRLSSNATRPAEPEVSE